MRSNTPRPSSYSVVRGDTLYSIAFRYGLDHRGLAAANGIAAPYRIYPGQKLLLRERAAVAKSAPKPAQAKQPSRAAPAQRSGSPGQSAAPAATKTVPAAAAEQADAVVKSWQWPASGRVTRGYSSSVHKGIDIAGERGDPVRAVAAGRVVYAGAGIAGYGELLIVRHNAQYLSAYGHNDRLLVREGQQVAAGDRIATRGSTGTNSVKLHFEIRRNGKPIDPVKLLPKR